jgi:hypothetical protein
MKIKWTHAHTYTCTCMCVYIHKKIYTKFANNSTYRNIDNFICTSYVDVVICTSSRNIRIRRKYSSKYPVLRGTFVPVNVHWQLSWNSVVECKVLKTPARWNIRRYLEVLFVWEVNHFAMQITDFVTRLIIMTNRNDLLLNICVLCASHLHRTFRCTEYVFWPSLKCVNC